MPELIDQIGALARPVLEAAVVLAAAGTFAMAMLELAKKLFHVRLQFHRWRVGAWTNKKRLKAVQNELLLLASGSASTEDMMRGRWKWLWGEISRENVLFDQPTEKMMGQIQAASNVALEFPHMYPNLYAFLAGSPSTVEPEADPDVEAWRAFAKKSAAGGLMTAEELSEASDEQRRSHRTGLLEANQARSRIANLVARKLDAFQNETQYLWQNINQRVAFVISGGILYYVLAFDGNTLGPNWLGAMPLAIFGGLLSPFAKDVVSALAGFAPKKRV